MKRSLVQIGCAMALAMVSLRLAVLVSAAPTVDVLVKDDRGKPVSDAVVTLVSPGAASVATRLTPAVMDQQYRMFVPMVLVIQAGTPVTFPNRDNIRHHVYSFSPAKRFELPLYMGTPAAPVVFDKPGVVILGCNIHDWMLAYIFVSPTPYFAKTGTNGLARLGDVAPGTYEARVWQPRMREDSEKIGKPLTIAESDPERVEFVLSLKPERRIYPPPAGYGERP